MRSTRGSEFWPCMFSEDGVTVSRLTGTCSPGPLTRRVLQLPRCGSLHTCTSVFALDTFPYSCLLHRHYIAVTLQTWSHSQPFNRLPFYYYAIVREQNATRALVSFMDDAMLRWFKYLLCGTCSFTSWEYVKKWQWSQSVSASNGVWL